MTDAPGIPLSHLARDEWLHRADLANGMIRKGTWSREVASDRLRPWLAIACLCGADVVELHEGLEQFDQSFTDIERRAILAREICPRQRWARSLASARDRALDSLPPDPHPHTAQPAWRLARLADALAWDPAGNDPIPAYVPRKKEAA